MKKANKGTIRIFTWFEKDNGLEKAHWYINLMVSTSPYSKKEEKAIFFDIAKIAKSSIYSIDENIISVNFYRYKAVDKLKFLCELQRYAQDRAYSIKFDPLQF